jgi:hypothetical protein
MKKSKFQNSMFFMLVIVGFMAISCKDQIEENNVAPQGTLAKV